MKKIKRFAYAGAVLLLSAGFAACSSTDDALETSNFIEKGAVKTEFKISIPGGMKTRMAENVTQSAGTIESFRGMQKVTLIPFVANGATVFQAISASDARYGNNLTLGVNSGNQPAITAANTINGLNPDNNSQLYKDVEVQIGTRSFLFYGEATPVNATVTAQVNGQLNEAGLTGQPSDINFTLQNIYTGTQNEVCTALITYLNKIVSSCDWNTDGKALHEVYTSFTTLKDGSSLDVQAAIQDLYDLLKPMTDAQSAKVREAILDATYVVGTSTTVDEVTTFTPTLDTNNNLQFNDVINGYPNNIYLPDGAARLKFENGAFAMDTSIDNMDVASLNDYVYPASLWYRGNSLILVADESKESAYVGQNHQTTWENVLKQYNADMTPGAVSAETKSIAIKDQIQYAVGRMDLYVKSAATLESAADKNGAKVTINANQLAVTGILIAGQKKVDFEFKPIASETAEKTIWDNQMLKTTAPGTDFTPEAPYTRTLVLETAEKDEDGVRFAIEFQNNSGKDFMGADGIVPAGCKFYLLGTMIPYGTNKNATGDLTQVFKQDYYTIVNANVVSLAKAHNVIPDLRAPKLELGLSVNLTWNAANTYSVTME